jgi:hypothetical protein
VTIFSYAVIQVVWAVALSKPLPENEKNQGMLPPSIYRQISPEINRRLRSLNEWLNQFWKKEAERQ